MSEGGVGTARFSDCGRYRFTLTRDWSAQGELGSQVHPGTVCWVMLNPSTATEHVLDPTIRRCLRFTHDWGYRRLVVVNLFALRSTDPKGLLRVDDPVGEGNVEAVLEQVRAAEVVVAAWGAGFPTRARQHVARMRAHLVREHAVCLGLSKDGEPRHPLMLRADTERMELWP